MKRKVFVLSVLILLSLACRICPAEDSPGRKQARETIYYDIFPFGSAVYQDFGEIEFRGKQTNLVIFKTDAPGLKDTETIFSEPKTLLPLWIERNVSLLMHQEYLTEEYFPRENRLLITKYVSGKKVGEFPFKAQGGPIHNAILLPFSLRKASNLAIGWSCQIRLPDTIEVKLVSIEEIKVPAGKFSTYHFTSNPDKFEIWITNDKLRLPVKIEGAGGLSYTLSMTKHELR